MNQRLSRREFLAQTGALSLFAMSSGMVSNPLLADEEEGTIPNPVITYPGVWSTALPKRGIILIVDDQLTALTDPDQEVDVSTTTSPNIVTLRGICEGAQSAGVKTLILAFDEFWRQYRPDLADKFHLLFPDSDEYIEKIGKISRFAAQYGLGLELSLLSPLELGSRFAAKTNETGRWVQFREGHRDPVSGRFTVSLWEHKTWGNNKGYTHPMRTDVRVFAFREGDHPFNPEHYFAVDEENIVELTGPFDIAVDADEGLPKVFLTVSGTGNDNKENRDLSGFNRVMAVVSYQTQEMDYFSPQAKPFLENLVDKYKAAGVELNALYSDEIHIQQDWNYFGHHDGGQFAFRYLSDGMIRAFAEKYGEKYRDFEKYLVYFMTGLHDFSHQTDAALPVQHTFSSDGEGIQTAWLLRRRYYDLLHQTVVDLFAGAKKYAESIYGHSLEARAHATWAQSPTIDHWRNPGYANHYEYTSDFIWSNTVHQASAACDDYFRWNDFLTGGGNDHAEGGWADRDYYGQAIACSTGSLNDVPNAYAAVWGMPKEAIYRHRLIETVYGNSAPTEMKALEEGRHREIEVLMLYPLSLVACQERFGSWMTQYSYANYITAEKLLKYGVIQEDGTVDIRGRRYSTICALYETVPPAGLVEFLQAFQQKGGKIVWSGPPALVDLDGNRLLETWQSIFSAESIEKPETGISRPGYRIEFDGLLAGLEPQTILTDFPVDAVYAGEPSEGVEIIARCGKETVGWRKGNTVYLGFRPRDDQSASLGYEMRVWFEVLNRLGAYPDFAPQAGISDNPSVISRTGPYLAARFPNGAIALAKHYHRHVEKWAGGFHRDAEVDAEAIRNNPLDSDALELNALTICGKTVDYRGNGVLGFRTDDKNRPIAFYGVNTHRIAVNGTEFIFADQEMPLIAYAPVAEERRVPNGAVYEIWINGEAGKIRLPLDRAVQHPRVFEKGGLFTCGGKIAAEFHDGLLEFDFPGGNRAYFLL